MVRWLAITEFWGPFVWFQRGEIVRERLEEEYKKSLEMILNKIIKLKSKTSAKQIIVQRIFFFLPTNSYLFAGTVLSTGVQWKTRRQGFFLLKLASIPKARA